MKNPDIYIGPTFDEAFQNTNGQTDWINDREKLTKSLYTQIQALDNHPTSYRALARKLIRITHDLDTLIKGGGLFERGMSGIKIPGCFVPRCDAIKEELLHQGRLLIDSLAARKVACAVELISLQICRLTLSSAGDGDPQARGTDLMVKQLRAEVLGRRGVDMVNGRRGDLWEGLDFAVSACDCEQCERRFLGDTDSNK